MKRSDHYSLFSFRDRYFRIFLVITAVFIGFKIPSLHLPYFWDEAWSYIPAVTDLYRNGPSMLPSALPPEISRGHPLLFYFLAATWMKIFGTAPIAMHSFAMVISISLLLVMYTAGRKIFNPETGLFSVAFLCLQEIFIAQSSFVLPEIMLALWTLLSVYLFVRKKYAWFIFFSSLMLLTKETGIAILFSIGVWTAAHSLWSRELFKAVFWKKAGLIFLPVMIASVFFIIQYYTYGWFFFPEHVGMMHFDAGSIRELLRYFFYILFIQQGKDLFSITVLIAGVLILIRWIKERKELLHDSQLQFTGMAVSCIICMFAFSSVNYFTYRYLLCLFPFYFLLGSYFILMAFPVNRKLSWVIFVMLLSWFLKYDLQTDPPYDSNTSYADGIRIQQAVTSYAEQNNLYERQICVSFLYHFCLGNPDVKFLSTSRKFTHLTMDLNCDAEYIVHSSIEENPRFPEIEKQCRLSLLKRFRKGKAWAEIYRIEK